MELENKYLFYFTSTESEQKYSCGRRNTQYITVVVKNDKKANNDKVY